MTVNFIDERNHQLFHTIIKGSKVVEDRFGLDPKPWESLCQSLDEVCRKSLWILV
ncbi:MAG: hypothetical protein JW963_20685 [Anaerolineales bacterium]|nr:hypothetical protein [Anaerolineales bacterium]